MPEFNGSYITTTVGDFKDHFSRYNRYLERNIYQIVFVKRYNEVIGYYVSRGAKDMHARMEKLAKKEGRMPASSYVDDVFRDK